MFSSRLNELLEPDNRTKRSAFKEFLKDTIFVPRFDVSLQYERQLALERLKKISGAGFISVFDFEKNPLNIFAAHEICGMVDGSFTTKLTVQWNLFGGTMIKLGTERHRHLLPKIDSMDAIGCFGLTELGYGNNAIEMETTATWDPTTKEWIINTPTVTAQKYWITNGALHAKWVVVFAQTIIHNKQEGIHVFLVRIRNENMTVCPGVTIDEMGYKFSCNGVDNAKLAFKNVRIPSTNILNKYSDIDKDGKLVSSIEKRRDRFLVVADQLLAGRLCIAAMSLGGAKKVLTVAIRYANSRLTVGPTGKSDYPIIKYQLLQNAIVPLVTRLVVLQFGFNYIKQQWANNDSSDKGEIVRLCCVIKPLVTWLFENASTVCRERCGGQGYLAVNELGNGIGFSHAGMTAEGDNSVLMQKVAKELVAALGNGSIRYPDVEKRVYDVEQLSELVQLIKAREVFKLKELAGNMAKKTKTKSVFEVWMLEESDLIQETSKAYGERVCLEQALLLHEKETGPIKYHFLIRQVLLKIITVFVHSLIVQDMAWFMIKGLIHPNQGQVIKSNYHKSIKAIATDLNEIIKGFDIREHMIFAPIAKDWKEYNKYDNRGELIHSRL